MASRSTGRSSSAPAAPSRPLSATVTGGSVQVTNLTSPQAVSGNVNVGNLPSTFYVGNFPAVQNVSQVTPAGTSMVVSTDAGQYAVPMALDGYVRRIFEEMLLELKAIRRDVQESKGTTHHAH